MVTRHGDERARLDHGDILVERGFEHHAAEARIGEHRLDDDETGDEIIQLQQDDGERRDQRVAQRMLGDDVAGSGMPLSMAVRM